MFHAPTRLQSSCVSRKLIAIALIAAVLCTIVVIVTIVATALNTPAAVAVRAESARVLAQSVALAANVLLRAPPVFA